MWSSHLSLKHPINRQKTNQRRQSSHQQGAKLRFDRVATRYRLSKKDVLEVAHGHWLVNVLQELNPQKERGRDKDHSLSPERTE